jgi:hypothetical protein
MYQWDEAETGPSLLSSQHIPQEHTPSDSWKGELLITIKCGVLKFVYRSINNIPPKTI